MLLDLYLLLTLHCILMFLFATSGEILTRKKETNQKLYKFRKAEIFVFVLELIIIGLMYAIYCDLMKII